MSDDVKKTAFYSWMSIYKALDHVSDLVLSYKAVGGLRVDDSRINDFLSQLKQLKKEANLCSTDCF